MCQRLKEWIAQKDMPLAEFGRRIGRTRLQIHRYIHKGVIPRPDVMDRIAEVTEGYVTAAHFYGRAADAVTPAAPEAAHAA